VAFAVAEADGVLRADLLTGVGKAALTHSRNLDDLLRAGVAGKLDNIDQRRLVVLVGDDTVLQALAGGYALVQRAQGHAHGQTDALGDDGSLQKDAAAQGLFLTGNNLEGQLTHQLLVIGKLVDLIGHAGNLSEHLTTDIRYGCINASHCYCSFLIAPFATKVTCRRANPLLLKFYQKTVFIARGQATKKQENPCKIQKFSCGMGRILFAAWRHTEFAGVYASINSCSYIDYTIAARQRLPSHSPSITSTISPVLQPGALTSTGRYCRV